MNRPPPEPAPERALVISGPVTSQDCGTSEAVQKERIALAAKESFERSGERWTMMRAEVFRTLLNASKPVTAYEVAKRLSVASGRRVAANSVYRMLDLFVAANLATRVESANAYFANPHPGSVSDCILLVCDGCGRTVHIDDEEIAARVRHAAQESGFSDGHAVMEVRRRCQTCAGPGTQARSERGAGDT